MCEAPSLIEDGTYFVHEEDGEIVACGGWSRRNKLFNGAADADDDSRLLDPRTVTHPDGVQLDGVAMERPVTCSGDA